MSRSTSSPTRTHLELAAVFVLAASWIAGHTEAQPVPAPVQKIVPSTRSQEPSDLLSKAGDTCTGGIRYDDGVTVAVKGA